MASCQDYALHYISRYPKTEQELRIKLLTKHYDEEDIAKTMARLKKMSWVDDAQFVRLYFQSECAKKGKPPYVVRQKLLQKWVDKALIERLMKQMDTEIGEGIIQRIQKEIEKLKKKGMDGFDIITKIAQKGYKIGDIKQALKERDAE